MKEYECNTASLVATYALMLAINSKDDSKSSSSPYQFEKEQKGKRDTGFNHMNNEKKR